MLINKEFAFWNNLKNVAYFVNKLADWRIARRLEKIPLQERIKMQALDLGCGGGRHTKMLCNDGFITTAIDINPEMLKATKQQSSSFKNKPKICEGSMLNMPFMDNHFDVIVATGVLHQAKNVDEYTKAIKELRRIAKDNCVVCLNVFTNLVLDETYIKTNDDYVYITKEGLLMCLLSKELFIKLMINNGFILETEYSEDIVQENTGKRAVLRCDFVKKPIILDQEYDFKVITYNNISIIGNVSLQNHANPFVANDYDFDNQKGFYAGNFKYTSPISNETVLGTAESYGRAKVVRFLLDHIQNNNVVLDIGAGCLNIYRELNDVLQRQIDSLFVSIDISGPFNSLSGGSLTKGAQRIIKKCISTFALEYDINSEKIPFKENVFDYIISCMTLHHITPKMREDVFHQIYRILKGGGCIYQYGFLSTQ